MHDGIAGTSGILRPDANAQKNILSLLNGTTLFHRHVIGGIISILESSEGLLHGAGQACPDIATILKKLDPGKE
ncbi:MAG: hypothetical protein IPL72_04975 [Sulfuritalea sp.]|nr:hypothetical protein [Sulfuritalea sp.]